MSLGTLLRRRRFLAALAEPQTQRRCSSGVDVVTGYFLGQHIDSIQLSQN